MKIHSALEFNEKRTRGEERFQREVHEKESSLLEAAHISELPRA